MPRYFIEISYDGSAYHGWQIQNNATTVQEVLNHSLSKLLREDIKTTGSGRTDTGVHCRQQFAHFDTEQPFDTQSIQAKLNSFLPSDIATPNIFEVKPEVNTRYDAVSRSYIYQITKRKNPFFRDYAFYQFQNIDLSKMNQASKLLLTHSYYEFFCKTKVVVNNYECDISEAGWKEENDLLVFRITANRFLRGMVRLLSGSLLKIGLDKLTLDEFKNQLENKTHFNDRYALPAHGLYLAEVKYDWEKIRQ